jgi:hypothetical protein
MLPTFPTDNLSYIRAASLKGPIFAAAQLAKYVDEPALKDDANEALAALLAGQSVDMLRHDVTVRSLLQLVRTKYGPRTASDVAAAFYFGQS